MLNENLSFHQYIYVNDVRSGCYSVLNESLSFHQYKSMLLVVVVTQC